MSYEVLSQDSSSKGLFLLEAGIHPDATSLFVGADGEFQEQLIGAAGIIRSAVAKLERDKNSTTPLTPTMQSVVSFMAIPKILEAYPTFREDYHFAVFRRELARYCSADISRIEAEMRGIADGSIALTDAQQQQLCNLSDSDVYQYLLSFGIDGNDLDFPLLDIGTGQSASFAKAVMDTFPGQQVISTSMHLANPNSHMSQMLAGVTDRGSLVAASGTALPFRSGSMGMVVSRNADPYYIPKRDLAVSLSEKHRVLRAGAIALLCPAVCDYGQHDITEADIEPLKNEMDISIRPIPRSGHQFYRSDTRTMLVIQK